MFDLNKYKKGQFKDIESIKNYAVGKCPDLKYTIPPKYQYRPDLIANDLYNDVTMADHLAIINDITDTPFGFYAGRSIKYLDRAYKENV